MKAIFGRIPRSSRICFGDSRKTEKSLCLIAIHDRLWCNCADSKAHCGHFVHVHLTGFTAIKTNERVPRSGRKMDATPTIDEMTNTRWADFPARNHSQKVELSKHAVSDRLRRTPPLLRTQILVGGVILLSTVSFISSPRNSLLWKRWWVSSMDCTLLLLTWRVVLVPTSRIRS